MMFRYTPRDSSCLVYTFKDGLLSSMAHDLELEMARYEIAVDEERQIVEAVFDPASIRVVTALKDGLPSRGLLGESYFEKIARNARRDVLEVTKYQHIRFRSTDIDLDEDQAKISGELELHGTKRIIDFLAWREDDDWLTSVTLDQRDFNIRPYSALMGALKIQPKVQIRVRIPAA